MGTPSSLASHPQRSAHTPRRAATRTRNICMSYNPDMKTTPTYAQRDALLITLGYATYDKYLRGALWRRIKAAGFEKHGTECRVCRSKAKVLHHVNYSLEVLTGEDISTLAPLCHHCHFNVEFNQDKSKRNLTDAQRQFAKMCNPAPLKPGVKKTYGGVKVGGKGHCTKCGKKARKGYTMCSPCQFGREVRGQVDGPTPVLHVVKVL